MASKSDLARRRFELVAAEYLQRMGQRMAERRKALGLTQEQVARALPGETSGAHVSRWERGLHRPSDDTLEALAKALQVDVTYFLAAQADKTNGTPDPFADQPPNLDARLERIETTLAAVALRLGITTAEPMSNEDHQDLAAITGLLDAISERSRQAR